MATFTDTLLDGSGAVVSTLLTLTLDEDPVAGSTGVTSRSIIKTLSNDSGVFTTPIRAGRWVARWRVGSQVNAVRITIPSNSGTYTFQTATDSEPIPDMIVQFFTDIAELLAADSNTWLIGVTLNSYGTDGIRSDWKRLLKINPEAGAVSDNGDSILETDDALAYAVKTSQP